MEAVKLSLPGIFYARLYGQLQKTEVKAFKWDYISRQLSHAGEKIVSEAKQHLKEKWKKYLSVLSGENSL